MFTNFSRRSKLEVNEPSSLLVRLLQKELLTIPIQQWGYFFPCHVAVWRFIETKRPGVLGELCAGYDKEPYFIGKGSYWFCAILGNDSEYLDLLERIMYPVVEALSFNTKERGFLFDDEMPTLDEDIVYRLEELILNLVDEGRRSGKLT